ncbi:hypothetical protein [Mycolicibacterium thermoresistibile]
MSISARSYLLAGVAAVGATAVALAPVQPLPPDIAVTAEQPVLDASASREAVQLLAAVQGMTVRPAHRSSAPTSTELRAAVAAIQTVAAPNAVVTDPAPGMDELAPTAFPAAGNAIKDAYDLVEEYVAWGVSLAQWAVGWVPWVGLLSGQIGIFYTFGEAIAHSVVYNFADWVGGSVSFGQGVTNIGADTVQAVVNLVGDEVRWVRSFFPPLPPLPPIGSATGEQLRDDVGVTRVGSAERDQSPEQAPVEVADTTVLAPVQRNAPMSVSGADTEVPVVDEIDTSKSDGPVADTSTVDGSRADTLRKPGSRTPLRETLREVARAATDSVERARGAGKDADRGSATKPVKRTATTTSTPRKSTASAAAAD